MSQSDKPLRTDGFATLRPLSSRRPITRLLKEIPFRIGSAVLSDHVAVLKLVDPLPPVGPLVHNKILSEARRSVRRRPQDGPVAQIEVWAPEAPGRESTIVFREVLENPIRAGSPALRSGSGLVRAYLIHDKSALESRARTISMTHHPSVAGNDSPFLRTLFLPPVLRQRLGARLINSSGRFADFVEGLLAEAGFRIRRIRDAEDFVDLDVSAEGSRAMARCFRCFQEAPAAAVDAFVHVFVRGRFDEGLFVTDGSIPYGVRQWERGRSVHLIGRWSLQRLVDATASRLIRTSSER